MSLSAAREGEDLAAKVKFLSRPQAYAPAPRRVEVRQTHMSWLFLIDDRVYKLKKPVRYAFLDFSTIEKRRFFCAEEVRLNRRLAADTYLGTVALYRRGDGGFSIGGRGRVVDWLVEMRRLPAADMLDERIGRGQAGRDDIERVAALLGNFYAGLAPERAQGGAYLAHLVEEHHVNRALLSRTDLAPAALAAGPLAAVEELLERVRPEILARIAAGRIVEGHGDLRPEHVCLSRPPQIIDCLEFNRAMRIIDPFDEVNYLGMECEMRGAPWIRPVLAEALRRRLAPGPSADLLRLYGAFRALLRARLCVAHLLERPVRQPRKWRPLAKRYLDQAGHELGLAP